MLSALILTITNATISNYVSIFIISPFFGSLFGLTAGIIGICLSFVSEIQQMKCLWISFIILVCYKPLVLCSILISSVSSHPLLQWSPLVLGAWMHHRPHSTCIMCSDAIVMGKCVTKNTTSLDFWRTIRFTSLVHQNRLSIFSGPNCGSNPIGTNRSYITEGQLSAIGTFLFLGKYISSMIHKLWNVIYVVSHIKRNYFVQSCV